MTGTEDDKYSFREILDGKSYICVECGPTDREVENFSSQPTFRTQNPFQKDES